MAGTKLTPEKITSPIQLMAAWFAMLILLVSVFLTAAVNIRAPVWAAGFLVIFSSVVTLIVISCVTLMLTVFRPHLQEGKEYAQWLKEKNSYSPGLIDQEKTTPRRAKRPAREASVAPSVVDRSFHIEVNSRCPGASELLTRLRRSGFQPERYADLLENDSRTIDSLEEHACIWIGARVQAAGAVEAIKLALDVWPHLKYMELSTDGAEPPDEVHETLFLGGATSTARERGLRPWTRKKFELYLRQLRRSSSMRQFVQSTPNRSFDADTHRQGAASRVVDHAPRGALPPRAGQL